MKKRLFSFALAMVLIIAAALPVQAYDVNSLTVKKISYDEVSPIEGGYLKYQDGKWGLCDPMGNAITPAIYTGISDIIYPMVSDGMVAVAQEINGEELWGFVDTNGNVVVQPQYVEVGDFSDGLAMVSKRGPDIVENNELMGPITRQTYKYGFIDKAGKEVIPLIYDSVSYTDVHSGDSFLGFMTRRYGFSEGLVSVEKDGKWGVIDTSGNTVIPFTDKYGSIGSFHDGLACVSVYDKYWIPKYGYIDKTGKLIIPVNYDLAEDFSDGYAQVGISQSQYGNRLHGVIDTKGNVVVPIQYPNMGQINEGMVSVSVGYDNGTIKWGFCDMTGKLVVPMIYSRVYDYQEGFAVVAMPDERFSNESQRRYGFINKQGEVVVPIQYSGAESYQDGIAVVSQNVYEYVVGMVDGPLTADGTSPTQRAFDGEPKYICIDRNGKEVFSHSPKGINRRVGNGDTKFYGEYGIIKDWETDQYIIIKNPCYQKQVTPTPVGNFKDVLSTDYYADAVTWAIDKGITSGTSTTTFSPNETCSTAQIITFLWRANGSPAPSSTNPFSDLPDDQYYTKAAIWAHEKGLMSGTEFGANTPCTRSNVVTYLWKLAGKPTAGANSFSDVPASTDYAQAVAWAVSKGVTSGTSNTTFSPSDICTRGQIVTFLHRDLAK